MTEMTEQQKVELVTKVWNDTVKAAIDADMIIEPAKFLDGFNLRITSSEGAHAGARGAKLSTHDRDCNPAAYREWLCKRGEAGKSSFARAAKLARQGYNVHIEYARIMKDAEIGGFITKSDNPVIFISATCCHELAHSIHFWNARMQGLTRSQMGSPHGVEWQAIYRKLRRMLTNPMLREANKGERMPTAARTFAKINRPPSGTATGRVWEIADMFAHESRDVIIAECIQEGIAPGTAATQYAKWNRFMSQDD